MRPVARHSVNKGRSVRKFNKGARTVSALNIAQVPQRGGWRL